VSKVYARTKAKCGNGGGFERWCDALGKHLIPKWDFRHAVRACLCSHMTIRVMRAPDSMRHVSARFCASCARWIRALNPRCPPTHLYSPALRSRSFALVRPIRIRGARLRIPKRGTPIRNRGTRIPNRADSLSGR